MPLLLLKNTSISLHSCFIFAIFMVNVNFVLSQYPTSRNGPPRFKQNARMHQYAYLGDNIKFQCKAIGRPQPKVHWYREGAYLNYSFTQAHPRFREKSMSLEIRRIEVGDKGNWMCRVWNNEGSTTRNFTLHIVDFCDYFLNLNIELERIPEECLCQWASLSNQHHTPHQEDTSAETDPDVPLLLLPPLREDLNLSKYTTARCSKYANLEELARFPRPSTTLPTYQEWHSTSSTNPPPTTTTNHPPHPAAAILNMNAKLELASSIVKKSASIKAQHNQVYEEEDEDYDEDEEEMHNKNSNARHVTLVTPNPGAHVKAVMVEQGNSSHVKEAWMSTVKPWPQPPTKVAPYFRNVEELQGGMSHIAHVVLPAGRTLKLTCKAGGQPEPQVVWRKDNMEIHRDTESKTGSLFLVRKWSLELEDAAESDSGNYACEVFNSVGSILRKFRVDIQDRIRSRPILVPNVLLNQTIDVNNSVKFTCQVISDLVPHIVWIKLLKKNGSFVKWDPKTNQHSFNFLDMSTVKKAKIYHNNSTNKYILEIKNVSLDDQGIYSCIAGNTLGMSMANATLIVNEFRPMTLPTENPYSWPISYTILLILSILLTLAFVTLTLLYFFFSKKFAKQSRVQNMDKMSVRKKVVITKKMQKDGDFSDLASTYAITVEPVFNANGSADLLPGAKLSSEEVTLLSDYEVPTDTAWEIDRNRLRLSDVVGEGAFGEVWRGTLRAKYIQEDEENAKLTPVAVKKLKMAAHEKELIILVSEMQIFKSIGEHPNILKLIGCCTGLGPLMVVLELCPHGNLRDFLRKHRPSEDDLPVCLSEEEEEVTEETIDSQNYLQPRAKVYQNVQGLTAEPALIKNLTLRDLVQFALEIARGMEFLASKKIIHRDLAARNVLVAENYSMKISDFGLSRNVIYHDYYRKRGAGRLPIKWMAPEALEANVYTVYSDVWSYGILLWEIMTLGGTPYPSIAMPQLYNILKEGYRMESPHNCPDEIYSVMVMCWQDKADQRPHFKTIADYFDWMLVESANQTNKSDDGETTDQTDEGPYAVINETPDKGNDGKRKTRPFSAPGLMSFEAFASTGGGARELTDMAGEEENVEVDEKCPLISSFLEEHQEVSRKKSSLINQLQKHKVHSVDLITKHPHAFGSATNQEVPLYTNTAALPPSHDHRQNDVSDASSYFFDSAIGSPLMSPLEPDSRLITYENFDSGVRSTSNTLPRITSKTKIALNQNTTADHPKNQSLESRMHEYVNKQSLGYDNQLSKPSTATTTTTANSSNKSLQSSSSSSSSSSNSSKENRGASKFSNARDTVYKLEPFPTLGLPPMRPVHTSVPNKELNTVLPKKSVVSEHRLKVNGVNNQGSAFSSSAQQNRKIGFIGQAGSSGIGLSKQSSTSNESNNSAVRKTQLNVDIRSGHVQRSRSVESTKSSGHGGSSAMSSAEGLGLCQVEYIMIEAKEPNKHAAPVAIKDNNSVKYN